VTTTGCFVITQITALSPSSYGTRRNKLTSIPWAVWLSRIGNDYSHPAFWQLTLILELGQTDLVFGMWQGSLVQLCMQNYKSLSAVVTIPPWLTSRQTHRCPHTQTDNTVTSLY